MRVSLARILILTVTVTLLSMAQTGRLSREENLERLKVCGIPKKSKVLGGKTRSAPFLIKLEFLANGSEKYQSGVLISKRHVITHPSSLNELAFKGRRVELDHSPGMCEIPISKEYVNGTEVTTCGTDLDCKTNNESQTPSSALYIGPCDYASSELGILLLEFDTNFHDQATFPLCLDEGQFEFGDELFLVGLGNSAPDVYQDPKTKYAMIEGKRCGKKKDKQYVCTDPIACGGDLGAPFIAKRTQQDNQWRVVAIASADACQDKKSVNQHLLVNKFTDSICYFSGVCTMKSGSTARISGKPTTTTPRMPTTSRTSKTPTSEPTTPAATRKATSMPTSAPTTTSDKSTATGPLSTTTKATTTVTPSPPTSSEPSKPTTASMSTLHASTVAIMDLDVVSTKPSTAPVTEQKTTTPSVLVIDIEDEPGLEDEEEEETEYVYIDEPDASSRDTSLLLPVLIFLSSIFLLH